MTIFKATEGSKRRLAIVERFNRTPRRLIEKQIKLQGNKELKYLIPDALDLYNRYLNHREIQKFFRRNHDKGERWKETSDSLGKRQKTRFFPAMMLLPGMEQEYIQYMRDRTRAIEEHYADHMDQLQPGTLVRYFKRNMDPFAKSRGSTMSEPVRIIQRHTYNYATDKSTRSGAIKQRMQSVSYSVEGTTQRFLPYELQLVNGKNKKMKSG